MGFKRTSEGRVFFQGADEPSTAKKADFRSMASASAPQATQFQILTLLKSLNEKLKDSQADRAKMRAELDAYRKHIEELEDKSSRTERAYLDLEQKLGKGGNDKAVVNRAERAEKLAEDAYKELQETRKLLLEIEDKSERADKATLTLQKQLGQTRAIGEEILKKQTSYEDLVKRLDVAETKHDDLTQVVEKTTAEQSRILRQIEKVAEDRTRFMRKIERIEETVIQTRDALSAKAMVLLTEHGAASNTDAKIAGASVVDQVISGKSAQQHAKEHALDSLDDSAFEWRTSHLFQAGVAIAVLTLGVLGGWIVSTMENNPFTDESFQIGRPVTAPPSEAFTETEPEQTATVETPAENTSSLASESSPFNADATSQAAEPAPLPENPGTAYEAADDIGTLDVRDEQKLARMLEEDPDRLAAELNKIEPGSAPPPEQQIADAVTPVEKPAARKVEPARVRVQEEPTPVISPQQAEAIKSPIEKPSSNAASRIKPDSSLSPEAKAIEQQAFAGVPEAQHDLAAIYTAGQGGVKQDYDRAAFWFREAANQGIANARYNLGVLYHQGLGVKPDIKEAIRWYKSAAELGHPEAQYNLGIAYIEGIGVGYDPQLAANNFESAARQGIVEAAYNLGLIYENGLLGQAQPDQALHWYKTASDQGSPEAKEALEQLAKTLNINVEDINRIADGLKKSEAQIPSTDPGEIKASPVSYTPAHSGAQRVLTAQIQEHLMRAGLYPGPADGLNNPQMEDAIRSYQDSNNLSVDGAITNELLAHMLSSEGIAN
jgi:hypothetical protein